MSLYIINTSRYFYLTMEVLGAFTPLLLRRIRRIRSRRRGGERGAGRCVAAKISNPTNLLYHIDIDRPMKHYIVPKEKILLVAILRWEEGTWGMGKYVFSELLQYDNNNNNGTGSK